MGKTNGIYQFFCIFVVAFAAALLNAQPADDFQPGLNIDILAEQRVEKSTAIVLELLAAKTVDYASVTRELVAARREAEALLKEVQAESPQLSFEPEVPSATPIVILETVAPEEIQRLWSLQVNLRVNAVHAVLTDGPESCAEWDQVIGVGWRHRADLTKRALPLVEALREAHKGTMLLMRTPRVIKVRRDKMVFEDNLLQASNKWSMYGPAETTYSDQGMRRRNKAVRHADTMIWTKKEFEGNFVVEFNFLPHNEGTPGALFAICGHPAVEGTDLSVSCGETMDVYNYGVHAYHFSVHRSHTDLSNGRKVGNGLKLICSRSPDPSAETGKTYHVTIGKWENVVFFLVDGQLIHNYYDAGTFGPPLSRGSVGMRHWGGLDATYSSVRVYRLVEDFKR